MILLKKCVGLPEEKVYGHNIAITKDFTIEIH